MIPTRKVLVQAASAALVVVLTACGSQLDPNTVALANGAGAGTTGGTTTQTTTGSGSAPLGSVPGSTGSDGSTGSVPGTGTVPGTSTGTGSAPGTGTTAGEGANPGGPAVDEENSSSGAGAAGSCDGFDNDQPGISSSSIVIANASDVSGPSPGLFEPGLFGVRAYAAYFNATSDICGRKLEVEAIDTRTDSGGDQQAYARACNDAFAAVGSASIFDSGGASTADACGIPDVRMVSFSRERARCASCYAVQVTSPDAIPNAGLDFFKKAGPEAIKSTAILYINVGDLKVNAEARAKAAEARGYDVKYIAGLDASEFNYAPYVQQLKDKGIRFLQFGGSNAFAVRMAQAMQQQNYKPDFFVVLPTQYNQDYIDQGGAAVEGSYVQLVHQPFGSANPEMQLYQQWLQQVNPGAEPSTTGLYAWSAARLFVEKAIALGGKLTRASLIAAVAQERSWDANGLHVEQNVGGKVTGECQVIIQLRSSTWRQVSPGKYLCNGLTDTR